MAFDLNVFYVKDLYWNIVESQNKKMQFYSATDH